MLSSEILNFPRKITPDYLQTPWAREQPTCTEIAQQKVQQSRVLTPTSITIHLGKILLHFCNTIEIFVKWIILSDFLT